MLDNQTQQKIVNTVVEDLMKEVARSSFRAFPTKMSQEEFCDITLSIGGSFLVNIILFLQRETDLNLNLMATLDNTFKALRERINTH